MMVGVPVLLMVCDGACWPFVWVMAAPVGVCGWCVFQYCVAVVCASRRVPGVLARVVVSGACSGVGWLAACCRVVVVAGLVCVSWFRMLMCFCVFLAFVLSCWLVNNGSLCVGVRVLWSCVARGCLVGLLLGCYWVVVSCCSCLRACAWLACVFVGCRVSVAGVCGCLGCGCVVSGGVLPVWLGDAVAGGGVSVGFDVGDRVFTLGGVSAPGSGSVVPESGSSGVRVCVPCAVRVFGEGWCGLVLRRWARAGGVGVGVVSGLLGSAPGSGSIQSVASGSAPSSRVSVVSSGLLSSSLSRVSGSVSVPSVSSRGGRVGVGFGARVCDWGARVGVGGGVVSGGGVVLGWWARVRGRVSALVGGVGVWGLALLGVVFFVVLASVVVLVG